MPLLHIEPLPRRTTKGEILNLLCTVGGLRREQVGRIDLHGCTAAIEVPAGSEGRLAKALDGTSFKDGLLRAWITGGVAIPTDADDHFQRLAQLLNLESQAEVQQILDKAGQAEGTGDSLAGLVVVEETSGLGGRFIWTLAKRNRTLPLPWNRLEPGAPILLSAANGKKGEGWRGVVCERNRMELKVALNEPPGEEERSASYRLDLAMDEAARQRQLLALERARTATRDRLAELRRVLLGETMPAFKPEQEPALAFLDDSLNSSQQDAIRFALSAADVAILHGPPGTGKTTALIELIRQAVRQGQKVLACAPSNLGVDNMLERLLAFGERAVRLGHPARVLPALREHTLDLMVEDHDDTRQARKLAKKAFGLFRQASKWTRAKPEPGTRQQLRQEARALLDDARKLESQAVDRILNDATVICATLTGLDTEILGQRQFDLAVIDEAAQSTEPVCWLPLLRARCLILAGDHCQLPPTILSQEAARLGFNISLMERLVGLFGPLVTRRLKVQYRMHEAIMNFSFAKFLRRRPRGPCIRPQSSPVRSARRDGESPDADSRPFRRYRRSKLRGATGTGRQEPAQSAGSHAGRPEGEGAFGCRRGGGSHSRDRPLCSPGPAAARKAADSRPGDRQR